MALDTAVSTAQADWHRIIAEHMEQLLPTDDDWRALRFCTAETDAEALALPESFTRTPYSLVLGLLRRPAVRVDTKDLEAYLRADDVGCIANRSVPTSEDRRNVSPMDSRQSSVVPSPSTLAIRGLSGGKRNAILDHLPRDLYKDMGKVIFKSAGAQTIIGTTDQFKLKVLEERLGGLYQHTTDTAALQRICACLEGSVTVEIDLRVEASALRMLAHAKSAAQAGVCFPD